MMGQDPVCVDGPRLYNKAVVTFNEMSNMYLISYFFFNKFAAWFEGIFWARIVPTHRATYECQLTYIEEGGWIFKFYCDQDVKYEIKNTKVIENVVLYSIVNLM